MADVSFTATAIKPATETNRRRVTFGGTITPGMVLYYDGISEYQIADCTAASTDAAWRCAV